MKLPATTIRLGCAAALIGALPFAHADSLASSASSAGSASSGSVSGSLRGSSGSSTGNNKNAAVDYRVVDVASAPDRPGFTRLTLQADDAQPPLLLELPQAIAQQQRLVRGDPVQARMRVYGQEFTRGDTLAAFYLVLADDWYAELAARPLGP